MVNITEVSPDVVEDDDQYEEIDEFDEDEFNENESILERVAALVDVVPPVFRQRIYNSLSNGVDLTFGAFSVVGKGCWILVTSSLMVLVPVVMELEREQQAIQQEHQRTQAEQIVQ